MISGLIALVLLLARIDERSFLPAPRVVEVRAGGKSTGWLFRCPACEMIHFLDRSVYFFDGDLARPTFHPDAGSSFGQVRCHFSIENGEITYSEWSNHKLRLQTVALPAW